MSFDLHRVTHMGSPNVGSGPFRGHLSAHRRCMEYKSSQQFLPCKVFVVRSSTWFKYTNAEAHTSVRLLCAGTVRSSISISLRTSKMNMMNWIVAVLTATQVRPLSAVSLRLCSCVQNASPMYVLRLPVRSFATHRTHR